MAKNTKSLMKDTKNAFKARTNVRNGWTDKWMDGPIDRQIDGWMDRWTNGQTDRWMDQRWMDGWID